MKTLARRLWRHVFVPAAALLLQGLTPAAAADDFLPVDAAFKVQAQHLDGDRIALTWQIADGYYLYRDVTALQVDVTDYDANDRERIQATNVFGRPALLFYDAKGNEAAAHRRIGATDSPGSSTHLKRAIGVGSE